MKRPFGPLLTTALILLTPGTVLAQPPEGGDSVVVETIHYRLVDDASTWEGLAHVDILSTAEGPRVLATLYLDGGGYRVFWGSYDRGGLGIFSSRLREVAGPFDFLRDLEGETLETRCTIDVLNAPWSSFDCEGPGGTSDGTLFALRRTAQD